MGDVLDDDDDDDEIFEGLADDDKVGEDKDKEQIHILGDFQGETPEQETQKTETVVVECGSTEGTFRIQVKPYWSPRGAARFLELIALSHNSQTDGDDDDSQHPTPSSYYDGCALNRVVTK